MYIRFNKMYIQEMVHTCKEDGHISKIIEQLFKAIGFDL